MLKSALYQADAIRRALLNQKPLSTLREVLSALGKTRRQIAIDSHDSRSNRFGIDRAWDRATYFTTLENYPGSAYFYLRRRAIQLLNLNRGLFVATPGRRRKTIDPDWKLWGTAVLTQIRRDDISEDDLLLIHPKFSLIVPVLEYLQLEFEALITIPVLSKKELLTRIANLHWWLAQTMPFARGSAGIADALIKTIFISRGWSPSLWKVGVAPDLEAFLRGRQNYIRAYPGWLKLKKLNWEF